MGYGKKTQISARHTINSCLHRERRKEQILILVTAHTQKEFEKG